MSLFVPPRQFNAAEPEWMDRPHQDAALFADALARLEQGNKSFGGYRSVIPEMLAIPCSLPRHVDMTVLDFCCGAGDVMREFARQVRAQGRRVFITAFDANEAAVAYARERLGDSREMRVDQADALSDDFSYPAMGFDLATCTLALHHFERDDAAKVLRRMWRSCRCGMVVSDLRRNRFAIWLAWLLSPLLANNPICRHDAVASARAAFSMKELAAMAKEARIQGFTIKRQFPFRMILIAIKKTG